MLGDVEIHDGSAAARLPRAGERCVLAALALSAGHRLHVSTLIDQVWGEEPPDNAEQTLTRYIGTIRQAIARAGGRREWLRNHRPGAYRLDIDPDLVDYHRFTTLVRKARSADKTEAITAYRQAVQLRRGTILANVDSQWAEHRRYAIEQNYLDALCALYELQLAEGQHTAVATSATQLTTVVTPTDRMILLAIHALARSGQHAAIPEFVDRAAQRMWDIAGARPGAEVHATAKELIERPQAQLTVPATAPRAAVIMTATNSGAVYQSAGDQYVTGV